MKNLICLIIKIIIKVNIIKKLAKKYNYRKIVNIKIYK